MYIVAEEPLPTSSDPKADEEMVPLSALGMAKTALYAQCANRASAERNSLVGCGGTCRKSVACSIFVTLHA
jgi:hypothetical protein